MRITSLLLLFKFKFFTLLLISIEPVGIVKNVKGHINYEEYHGYIV